MAASLLVKPSIAKRFALTSYSLPWGYTILTRTLRTRVIESSSYAQIYTPENVLTGGQWPPRQTAGNPMSGERCRLTMFHLQKKEMDNMEKRRKFRMPEIVPGDYVEIKYELSRSQQTFATFRGYCVEVRNKGLNSSIRLKNAYDGIGVEQLVPVYSPRLIYVQIIKKMASPLTVTKVPITRDYRYRWQRFVRPPGSKRTWVHSIGIKSLEMKMRRRLCKIRHRYMKQRVEAGLPSYVWRGPYQLMKKARIKLVRADMYRRMLVYSLDEQEARRQKLRRRREKTKWGVFQIGREAKTSALTELPAYHPLNENLPK